MPANWTNPDIKTCKDCAGVFPCDEAHFYRSAAGYWNTKCKTCCRAVTKAWRETHPGYYKTRTISAQLLKRHAAQAAAVPLIAPNEEF